MHGGAELGGVQIDEAGLGGTWRKRPGEVPSFKRANLRRPGDGSEGATTPPVSAIDHPPVARCIENSCAILLHATEPPSL